ncbi:MAG: type II secretion system protein GspM [Pseudomonadota bacterium]
MSPVVSRLAALSLTVFFVVGLVLGVILPLKRYATELSQEISDLEAQYARFATHLATLEPAAPVVVGEIAVFEAESEAVGAALMQERLAAIIQESDGDLRRMRADGAGRAEVSENGLVRLPVSVEAETSVAGLKDILYSIEVSRPYLTIARLEVRRAGQATERSEQMIFVRLEIVGYMSAPSGS